MAETQAPTPRVAALIALATVLALGAYASLNYWLMVHALHEPWAVALLFGPLIGAVAATALKRRQFGLLAICAAATAGLVWVVMQGDVSDTNRMCVLQHAAIHLALGWTFGSSLRVGATPLITAMATGVHGGHLTPAVRDYTRWLTGLWTVYFVAIVAVSLLVYALAPWTWWSLFDSALTPAAMITLFVVEHIQRYRRHPEFERVSLRRAMTAYRHSGDDPPAAAAHGEGKAGR